mmetsp:Transcript_52815/g.153658  ORF Transcript_52815/g.153658 Transcript_52815/m.153658 type:complete len:243 (-) Transcript_52815:2412-3140(-)
MDVEAEWELRRVAARCRLQCLPSDEVGEEGYNQDVQTRPPDGRPQLPAGGCARHPRARRRSPLRDDRHRLRGSLQHQERPAGLEGPVLQAGRAGPLFRGRLQRRPRPSWLLGAERSELPSSRHDGHGVRAGREGREEALGVQAGARHDGPELHAGLRRGRAAVHEQQGRRLLRGCERWQRAVEGRCKGGLALLRGSLRGPSRSRLCSREPPWQEALERSVRRQGGRARVRREDRQHDVGGGV